MDTITQRLDSAYPKENGSIRVIIKPLRERIVGQVQPLLWIVFGAVGIVLIVACANVANLLVARASHRRREFTIRAALGARRSRMIAQSLTESGVLAAAGGALGLAVARWGTTLLILPIPKAQLSSMPFLLDAHINPAVLAFAAGAVILLTLACGVAGALESFHHAARGAINEESRASSTGARKRLRNVLVVGEVAFSLVLLIGAGLMTRSLASLLQRNPGFDRHNVLNFNVNLPDNAYPKNADAARFNQEFTNRLRALPGVVDVAATSIVPLTGGGNTIRFLIDNQAADPGHESECNIRSVSSNYFSLLGIPLISGRLFDDGVDTPEAPSRIIVNQAWVKRYLPDQPALGRRVKFTYSPTQPYREIVGVVGDIVDSGLDGPAEPSLFTPTAQQALGFISYLQRSSVPPATLLGPIRHALAAVDSRLVLMTPLTLDEIVDQSPSVFLRRYPSYLIGSFAVLALFLAVIGLYGLISYSVAQRTRELGVRIALGACPKDVMRLVLGEGARLIFLGIGAGVVSALALTRLMSSLLFGIGPADPATFLAVIGLLALVAGAACFIPARRAVRTDPIIALREY
jgi:putative ABC transport system permease protein